MTTQTVHVRINDRATGQPTPVRLRISGDGEYYAPFGRLPRFASGRYQDVGGNLLVGRKAYAYVDGTCEVSLPAGPLTVEIWKGPEYLPRSVTHEQIAGKISLRLDAERWADLRSEGWYSGDARAHALTPHAALLEAQAEDLAVVNLLAEERAVDDTPSSPNILAFSGQAAALEKPGHMVVVNTHNVHPTLGSLALLNCHRVVHPLRFGPPHSSDNWTLLDWCQQCHRKIGLVVWSDTGHESAAFRYGEPLADLLLGQIDAFEVTYHEDSPFDTLPDWYNLLNCGLRVPLVGASGKDSNCVPLGAMRTYARIEAGEPLTYHNWIEAVRAGRTFITNGPIISLSVTDKEPGSVIRSPASCKTVSVQAEARSALAFENLELVVNGKVMAQTTASGTPISSAVLQAEISLAEPRWIAARCNGARLFPQYPAAQRVFAHTSPVYVDVEGKHFRREPSAVFKFAQELERMMEWAQREARCPTEHDRERLLTVFDTALKVLHDAD